MAEVSPTKEELLVEIEDLLRTMPAEGPLSISSDANHAWLGRAMAIMETWNFGKGVLFSMAIGQYTNALPMSSGSGFREMMRLLHQARYDLRMKTLGPLNAAIPHGGVFDYFDEIRKAIEQANEDLLFVDPYLDAEFVSRYLSHVRSGVTIRLLTSGKKLGTLLPAVDLFSKQSGHLLIVRSAKDLHDRYVFIDRAICYQSGASFKDGAKHAPTTLTQITDVFKPVLETYEQFWSTANVER